MASVEQYGALMRSQLGVSENPPGSNRVLYSAWYGVPAPWCQMFQNWAHVKLGMVPPGYDAAAAPKGSAYTPTCADWFRKRGRWSTRPQVGDLVYYDFPNDGVGRISHVGWVEAVHPDGGITAIEGNTDSSGSRTGGSVMRKVRRTGIVGFGRLDYEQEEALTAEQMKELKAHINAMAEQTARRTIHAIMTGGIGLWANPDRSGWEFYKDEVRAACLLDLAATLPDAGDLPATPQFSGTFTITGSGTVESPE